MIRSCTATNRHHRPVKGNKPAQWTLLTTLMLSTAALACSSASAVEDDNASASGSTSSSSSSGNMSSSSSGGGHSDGCPAAHFLDVSQMAGAGANYPAPTLDVSCSDSEVTVTSNGIPHYTFVATTPNELVAQNQTFRFPLTPAYQQQTSEIALLGAVAVASNGLPIYGPNEGDMPHPFGDPVFNAILDDCKGHTGPNGDYHYHALLVSCLTQDSSDTQPSPIVGYSFDGFPIYGPY